MSVEIHPTAQIEKGVQLGEGVRIGPFTYIQSGAEIGDNCQIGSSVWISEFVRMGDNNKIAHAAALGGDPQDLKFEGEKTVLRIGDNNDIREYVTMNRGTNASGQSVVGSNNMLMAYCHVAHDCVVGDNIVFANSTNIAGHVLVEDWVIVGGLVPVHQFCRLGAHAMIGAGARVVQDVPPYALLGVDPTGISGINSIGLNRRGFSKERIAAIKKAYRYLFFSTKLQEEAFKLLKQEFPAIPEIEKLVEFVKSSSRGIVKTRNKKTA